MVSALVRLQGLKSGCGLGGNGIATGVVVALISVACASGPEGRPKRLEFLDGNPVTIDEVRRELGLANATFEEGTVLTYRLGLYGGSYYVRGSHGDNWNGVDYDLVLVFGLDGNLRQHRLVPVQHL